MTEAETRAVRGRVHGRVQGVYFRAETRQEALRLGLAGWVRNLPDRTVEFHAQGPADAVERFLDWARRGPAAARVDALDVADVSPQTDATTFDVQR